MLCSALILGSASLAIAKSKSDRFYLPQSDQPFEGEVETRIGTLEFSNQYPSKKSMEALLDSIDFHGATQAYLWGIPIASFANLQYFLQQDFGFDQCDLMETKSLADKLGILTANATTPYIFCTPNLSKTGPVVFTERQRNCLQRAAGILTDTSRPEQDRLGIAKDSLSECLHGSDI